MDIRFGELYTVETERDAVTMMGQMRMLRILRSYLLDLERSPINVSFPPDWDWNWMGESEGFRGKLPGRIASLVKKQYGIKLTQTVMTRLGNIAKQYCYVETTYIFDFTKSFDWIPGDFGDHGSCYWGCRNYAREVLMRNGVLAIRFYRGAAKRDGFARAWIRELGDGILAFNAYGLPCKKIACVLSALFDAPLPEAVDLLVTGDPSNLIWLNEDAHAIGLGGGHIVNEQVCIEFDVPYRTCSCCDIFIHMDNLVEGKCPICQDDRAIHSNIDPTAIEFS